MMPYNVPLYLKNNKKYIITEKGLKQMKNTEYCLDGDSWVISEYDWEKYSEEIIYHLKSLPSYEVSIEPHPNGIMYIEQGKFNKKLYLKWKEFFDNKKN